MAKKKEKPVEVVEKFKKESIGEVVRDRFMPYSMSVIVSRSLPAIDGFKPSQRKVLYTMYQMGLLTGIRTKSANIAARTMLLNPHGDVANYETMVRMTTQNETLLTPWVDGKGSFGKHYSRDMQCAAARYTEAKLAGVASELFKSLNKNTVDMVDNYDSTRKEPALLPVTFPNILANPTDGIAVGMASRIPSFNLKELCAATVLRIMYPNKDIRTVMPGPDFATGGYMLMEDDVMDKIYNTGLGSIKLRSKYRVDKKNRIIEVYEIPFSTNSEVIIEGIVDCVKKGKIKEVNDVRDETDKQGLKIAIDYKRGVDPDILMKKLFKITKLQDTYSCNMNVLIDGTPKVLGVAQIIDEWIKWRRECVVREYTFDLNKKGHDLNELYGFQKLLLDIDKAVAIIRSAEDDDAVIPALMEGFEIDEEQAAAIAEIKLRNLNKKYILNKTKEISKLEKEIAEIKKILGNPKSIDKIIVKVLTDVAKKYGQDRKTEITEFVAENIVVNEIPDYESNVYITKEGYVKKIPLTSLRGNPEIKTKDGDEIVRTFKNVSNRDELLIFTDKANVYKVVLNDIADCKPSDLGEYANNLAGMEDGENLIRMSVLKPGEEGYVVIGFENGKTAKFPVSVYETKLNRKKLVNAFYGKEKALGIYLVPEDTLFVFKSSSGHVLVFDSKDIPLKATKTTQGVQTIRLAKTAKATEFCMKEDSGLGDDVGKFRYRGLPSAGTKFE